MRSGNDANARGELERSIARQARAHRVAAGLSVAEAASRVGVSKAMLSKIENAQTSCSLTTLARLATGLDVPVTALLRGVDLEREAVYVPAGHGARTIMRDANYELLGTLRGKHRRMDPILVTLSNAPETYPQFQHPGTELLYMLEGTMVYTHSESSYTLRPGDALQFDGEVPHGPEEVVRLPCRFLSVTAYGDHGHEPGGPFADAQPSPPGPSPFGPS
ncbi:MAG: XRE family transcriptional regulator [Micrococcales bacterium]|nr:XRE family transcriptional regulator [Micrococcales bacterium]MCL2667026.1 XRE family transcriptional regulator [Micrococcales bacterium]